MSLIIFMIGAIPKKNEIYKEKIRLDAVIYVSIDNK